MPRTCNGQRYAASSPYSVTLPRVTLPPKLQHILDENRQHNLVKFQPRDESVLRAPDFPDESDYDYSMLQVPESTVPDLSDEELDKVDAGETPRGDKSMTIDTEHGKLKSKYTYMGFGLWEDTDPNEHRPPPKIKLPSPPPSPPSEEDVTVWYNCTVSSERHATSKELDDLRHGLDGFDRMPRRRVEVGDRGRHVPASIGDLWQPFQKEDMSDMFKRAFLEKMCAQGESVRARHKCYVCREVIEGRIITAMSHKFHPECFVCQYCRNPFKERSFKSDADGRPYCHQCFEKLLGHFGSAHFLLKDLP